MLTTILHTIFLTQLIIQIIIRTPFQFRTRKNKIEKSTQTNTDKLLMLLVFMGMTVIPLFYIFTGEFEEYNYTPYFGLVVLGVILYGFGLWMFYYAHKDLGLNWSITTNIRKEHTLVTDGVYYVIRHPMYASIWLLVLAQPCILPNWVAGFSGVVTFIALYLYRVGREERLMIEKFGTAYVEYMGRTGRLIPKPIARQL